MNSTTQDQITEQTLAQLVTLRRALEAANKSYAKAIRQAVRNGGLPPSRAQATAAYRAFWAFVDANKIDTRLALTIQQDTSL